ncbi:MAG TPA: hypothetical protein VKT80_02725, partial [Chloroflexota bacterium]|nr:hypothetical protein [Chloroflexota bacterium]
DIPLYDDSNHPKRILSREFGAKLGSEMAGLTSGRYPTSYTAKFGVIRASACTPTQKSKSNHWMAVDLGVLNEGETIAFPQNRVIGFSVDIWNTRGFLKFSGSRGDMVKSVRFYTDHPGLRIKFISIPNGFTAESMTCIATASNFLPSFGEVRDVPVTASPVAALWKIAFWNE